MEYNLTKDAYNLLVLIYKTYLDCLKSNINKSNAKYFNGVEDISGLDSISSDENLIYGLIVELTQEEYIKHYVDGGFLLNSKAIISMENRFKNGFKEVVDFVSKLIP